MKKKIIIIVIVILVLIIISGIFFKNKLTKGIKQNKDSFDIKVIERKEANKISINDKVRIGNTEEFYVIDTNDKKTTLIAQYNLYVGANYSKYDEKTGIYKKIKTISNDETGYCLQNKNAVGNISKDKETIGGVYFSSNSYWTNENKQLLDKYGINELTDNSWTKNNIYDNAYNKTDYSAYSIAYFIELYVSKLKNKGDANIEGRILTFEELDKLGCHLVNLKADCSSAPKYLSNASFYISTAYNNSFVYTNKYEIIPYKGNNRSMFYKGSYLSYDEELPNYSLAGVRPVIIVKTSDIK